jgi:hypothetical protein
MAETSDTGVAGQASDGWVPGRWLRRPYEVRGGWIRPIPGGEIQIYRPFDGFYEAPVTNDEEPLYLALANLDLTDNRAIARFASSYGLLGLFFERLISMTWRMPCDGVWTSWIFDGVNLPFEDESVGNDPIVDGEVNLRRWQGDCERADVVTYAARYLPDLMTNPEFASEDHTSGISQPALARVLNSMQRWDHLAEPVDEFVKIARYFEALFRLVVAPSQGRKPPVERPQTLRGLLANIRTVPVLSPDGGVSLEWVFPSLLSAAHLMLFQDASRGSRLRYCENENCRRPMRVERLDKRFCSTRCHNLVRQRRYRARNKGDV